MAAIVVRDRTLQTRSHILHAGHFQQEPRKLPNSCPESPRLVPLIRPFRKNIHEMVRDHRSARTRRNNDVLAIAEYAQKMLRHFAGFLWIPAVKCRLSAARLGLRKIHFVSDTLQHFGCRQTHLWEELIDDTGDEQGCARHEASIVPSRSRRLPCRSWSL